jgi:DNA helicase-2/ATP-dependent DNA helicase PcrA
MHKTKGTGIENVIVVLDTYFWNKYNFKAVFDEDEKNKGYLRSLKLLYVAASRTKRNLICVKMIHSDDEALYQSVFPYYKKM